MIRVVHAVAVGSLLFLMTSPAFAAEPDPEADCHRGIYADATKYNACQQKVLTKYFSGIDLDDAVQTAFSKCRVKYAATWNKLRAKAVATGTRCDNPRFDIGVATTKDRLTGLEWERKTDDDSVHDRDNQYTWGDMSADGPVFNDFLATLNGYCFAGHCDWRLPTVYELQTILAAGFPCAVEPCVDESVFGPGYAFYWTGTQYLPGGLVWVVNFHAGGRVYFSAGNATFFGRAVRGGL
jgi:hypothetical protein